MTFTPHEEALLNELEEALTKSEEETSEAFHQNRDSLRTLRLQCKSGTIRNALIYAKREFTAAHESGEKLDIQRFVNLHEGSAAHMEDLARYNFNTADCAVYNGDKEGHLVALEIINKHRANF